MKDYPPYRSSTEIDAHSVSAGSSTLMRQAQMTACTYMESARSDVDELFGDGYAKDCWRLLAALQ
jgi:hypothetical protein